MATEISIRIEAKDMTSQQFDRLINELEETIAKTQQVEGNTLGFGNGLTGMQTLLLNTAEGAGALTDALEVVGQNFVQGEIQLEGYHNGLIALEESAAATDDRLMHLKETIQRPNVSLDEPIETAVQFRTVESEAQRANRSVTAFTKGLQTEAQIAVEDATLARLSNQQRVESEHLEKIRDMAAQVWQLEIDYELDKTRITLEEVDKRTQINEHATQLRIDSAKREAANQLKTHQDTVSEISETLREFDDINRLDSTYSNFSELVLTQDDTSREVLEQTHRFIIQTDGVESSLQNLETSLYEFSSIFRQEFLETLLSGASLLGDFSDRFRASGLDTFAEDVQKTDVISRVDAGQVSREQRTGEISAIGAETYQQHGKYDTENALSFVSNLPREQPLSLERLTEGTGNLVSAVPLDVVEALTDVVQVRRDANAALVQLEQEAAAEIKIIQESVTLTAENKAKAIERVERQTALERIRIENEVSQRQRESFQSVVTNFVSGIGQMIAAEAQLALARRATDALGGLFGDGLTAAAAASSAGLFSSVLFPLLGGLSLAYGATELIGYSSPSIDVYQKYHNADVGGSGARTNPIVVQRQETTSTEQETDGTPIEANITVNVEASGTRLAQANSRVQLKTERWGG